MALLKTWMPFLYKRFDNAIARRMPKKAVTQKLHARSIYILPTSYGVFLGFVLYCMLMASINYSNSMGFLLTFLLTGIVLVGMFYTYRNLAALQISAAHVKAVFAGDHAEFNLATQTNNNKAAYGIAIGKNRIDAELANIPQNGQQIYRINVPTKQRGYMPLGRLRVWCEFPLGLFHVWSWTEIDNNVLVYPKPQNILKHPPEHQDNDGMKASVQFGNDDFAGIRRYIAGDSPKHIAWKALARGHPVMTKQFAALASNEVWLDWYALNSMDDEQKLSQLCQWVLDMHKLGYSYGLKLPNIRIEPSNGEFHKLQCLEQLALFTS